MSKSGINTGFAKCFILFMAVVILAQGCLYFGLSIWGITQEDCSGTDMDANKNAFRFVLDLIYFIRQECGDVSLTNISESNSNVTLDINWNQSYMVTNRMYIFLIVYAIVSGLWIVGSLLVVATVCGPVTKTVSAFCFWPWFLFVIAGSILDAVATGYHINDIVHTTSAVNTFQYVGIKQPDEKVMDFINDYDVYFITPAVVLTCISSRVILIWLMNIFGASFCLSLSRVLAEQHKQNDRRLKHNTEFITGVHPRNSNQNETQSSQRTRPTSLIINASTQSQFQNRPQSQQSPQQRQMRQSPNSPNAPTLTPNVVVLDTVRNQIDKREISSSSPPSAAVTNVVDTTYRTTDNHPDRLDYPPKTPQSPKFKTTNSTAQLSTGSILNTRYSNPETGYNVVQNQNQNYSSPQRVSDELRSQLPWSYTSMIAQTASPRKLTNSQQIYPGIPGIPDPDYEDETNEGQQKQQQTTPAPGTTGVMNDIDQKNAYSRW